MPLALIVVEQVVTDDRIANAVAIDAPAATLRKRRTAAVVVNDVAFHHGRADHAVDVGQIGIAAMAVAIHVNAAGRIAKDMVAAEDHAAAAVGDVDSMLANGSTRLVVLDQKILRVARENAPLPQWSMMLRQSVMPQAKPWACTVPSPTTWMPARVAARLAVALDVEPFDADVADKVQVDAVAAGQRVGPVDNRAGVSHKRNRAIRSAAGPQFKAPVAAGGDQNHITRTGTVGRMLERGPRVVLRPAGAVVAARSNAVKGRTSRWCRRTWVHGSLAFVRGAINKCALITRGSTVDAKPHRIDLALLAFHVQADHRVEIAAVDVSIGQHRHGPGVLALENLARRFP